MRNISWLQGVILTIIFLYIGALLCYFVIELCNEAGVYFKRINNAHRNSTLRSRKERTSAGEVCNGNNKQGGPKAKIKSYATHAYQTIRWKAKVFLFKTGLLKSLGSKIDYKKKNNDIL